MNDSLKNTFTLYEKNCFFWKENQKWVPLAGKYFSVKIGFPNFNHGFQQQKKGFEQKHTVSSWQKIKFPLPGIMDLLKNMFSLDVKFIFGYTNVWKKIEENGFH